MTQIKGDRIEHHPVMFLDSTISGRPGPDPTQMMDYDEIRYARSCKKLKLENLGCNCKTFENQSLK